MQNLGFLKFYNFITIFTIIFTDRFNLVPNIDLNKKEVLKQFNQKKWNLE
ncbi:MAG: hypothetical protein ACLUD1_10155 [Clostridia bacterium]